MDDKFLLKDAPQFDVHKWSEYPEVNAVVDAIFTEIKDLRKSKLKRIRGEIEVKKSLKVAIIDLWASYKLSTNPYRGISKNKTNYQKGSRYNKIFLSFDYLIPVVNDLSELGYIEVRLGYKFDGDAKRTRIRATEKLINKILQPEYGLRKIIETDGAIKIVSRVERYETVILRDANKQLVNYEDNDFTNSIRENLVKINQKIREARITLNINDEQYKELMLRFRIDHSNRESVDFTKVELRRVFNNSSWNEGGRFYGGWWQNIPREYRKYIEINRKHTVEVDYSGHHIRILYAKAGLEPPDDPYDLNGYDRDIQKQAMLILINANNTLSARKAIAREIRIAPIDLLNKLELKHAPIKQYFYTGVGLGLMYEDSLIAEKVILSMMEKGSTVLPVHDSFIVRSSYQNELEEVMDKVFSETYNTKTRLKVKTTILELNADEKEKKLKANNELVDDLISINNITDYINDRVNNYSWYKSVWGF